MQFMYQFLYEAVLASMLWYLLLSTAGLLFLWQSCDMWSVGVILYIMLCGYPPFYSETPSRHITSEMKRKILSGKYEFPEEDWKFISDAAKDVVRR